jgi:hypothetical protein
MKKNEKKWKIHRKLPDVHHITQYLEEEEGHETNEGQGNRETQKS